MKHIALTAIFCALIFANDNNSSKNLFELNQDKYRLSLGAAGVFKNSIYRNGQNLFMPFPIINANYGDFYIKSPEAGYNFEIFNNIYLSPIVTYKFDGYKVSSSSYMNGMANRNNSFYAGGRIAYSSGANTIYVNALQDIANNSNGAVATIGYDYFYINLPFIVSPSIKYTFQNAMYSNYYYGVNTNETTPTRSYYSPGNTSFGSVNLYTSMMVTNKISIFSNIGVSLYDRQITNSPIVDKPSSLFLMMGATYKIY